MSPESTKVESAKYNPRPSVSRETLFLSGASLRWWDMATPRAALQELLDRRTELVCNGWVPVTTAVKVSALAAARRHSPSPWKKLGISPIKLLFGDRVNMSNVCHWFMQTTETRSLAIAKRTTLLGAPAKRRRKRRRRRRRRGPGEGLTGPRGTAADRGLGPGPGRRACARRRGKGGCGGPSNWLSRHHVERGSGCGCGVCRREESESESPPPDGDEAGAATLPQAHGTHKAAAAAIPSRPPSPQAAWTLLNSPPVLSVTGTDYKLVPVGNALPDPGKMAAAAAAEETVPQQGDSSSSSTTSSSTTTTSSSSSSCCCSQRPAPPLLGCLRECWVMLRNIEQPKRTKRSRTCSEEKLADFFQERRRRRKSLTPLKAVGYCQPGDAPWASRQEALPSVQTRPGLDTRPTSPTLLDCTKQSDDQKQRDSPLADVQWQLVGLKECRVTLKKINVLDGYHRNGCVGKQLSNVPSPCKNPTQTLERKVWEEGGAEVERHSESHGASFCRKAPCQWLATNNRIACAGAADFAKGRCFSSAGELNSRESGVKNKAKETFTDAKWSQRGLKECKVVLEKLTPLIGNPFITLSDDQLFRLGWDANRNKSNR